MFTQLRWGQTKRESDSDSRARDKDGMIGAMLLFIEALFACVRITKTNCLDAPHLIPHTTHLPPCPTSQLDELPIVVPTAMNNFAGFPYIWFYFWQQSAMNTFRVAPGHARLPGESALNKRQRLFWILTAYMHEKDQSFIFEYIVKESHKQF